MRLDLNNLWSLVEGVSSALFQLCVIALISRYGGLSDVGKYGFVVAISAPIFMLANMRLRHIYVSGRPECKNAFSACFALRVILSTCAALLIFALAWLFFPDMALVLVAVTLYKYFESLSDFIYSLFHRRAEMVYVARSSMLSAVLAVIAVWLVLDMGFGVALAMFSAVLVKMIVFVLHDMRTALALDNEWSIKKIEFAWIKHMVICLFPLGILAVLASFSFNAPRLYLGWSGDMDAAGIYTGLSHLVLGGAILMNAFVFPVLRELGESHIKGDLDVTGRAVRNLMYVGVLLGITAVLLVCFAGEEILVILYGSSFRGNWVVFVVMMLVGSLYYQVLVINHVGTAIGYYNRIVAWQGLSLAAISIGLFLLAPVYGVMGAGVAWGAGSAIQVILFLRARRSMLSLNVESVG